MITFNNDHSNSYKNPYFSDIDPDFSDWDRKFKLTIDEDLKLESNTNSVLPKFGYMILGAVGVFVVICILIKCCKCENTESRSPGAGYQGSRVQQSRHAVTRMFNRAVSRDLSSRICYHEICIMERRRQFDPFLACMMESGGTLITDYSSLTHTVIDTEGHNLNNLDLPPSYASSTSNLNIDNNNDERDGFSSRILDAANIEPPSYSYAVSHENHSNYRSTDDYSSATGGGDSGGGGGDSGGGESGGGGGCDSGGGGGGGDSGGSYD